MNNLIVSNRTPLFCLWLALIVTFAITRIVTAKIRKGSTGLRNWSIGGVHVHHQVFGILIMIIAGGLQFAYATTGLAAAGLATLFGVGAALTLDEFALWLRLDDVYWTAEGRLSVDAVFVAIAVSGLLLTNFTPLGVGDLEHGIDWEGSVAVALNFVFVLIAVYKGKPVTGALGVMVPFLALISAVRLAKPTSPWARRRYPEGSRKRRRADERFGSRYQARWNRVRDLIGQMEVRSQ
ncbi:MAG: hypothetical protein JOZ75_11555 [Candidatus Dormibacteraeota bacterium]|nr:hypothetical protein [Candidatus Dormibacteraeota bacterium]